MRAPAGPSRILVVDDDEGLLLLMAETLREQGYEVTTANAASTARAALQAERPDLLLLDLKLQDGSGPALVRDLQRERTDVPFVVVTGQGDEKVAVEVMKQGALDYVMKDTALLDLLPAVVKRAMAAVHQEQALAAAQTEHKRLEQEILAVGERERQSVGADLHDNLGQQLTALELMCTALKEDAADHPALTKGLERMSRMLREAVAQTRALARGLVPVGNEPDALQNGLLELATRTDGLGRVRCTFECPKPVALADSRVAGHLYRIAQEAVNNALKHAKARSITIRLSAVEKTIFLEVIDDGEGLRPAERGSNGVGLHLMRHRANVIGAELALTTNQSGGTTVSCILTTHHDAA